MSQHLRRQALLSRVRQWFTRRRSQPIRRKALVELGVLEPCELPAADLYNVVRNTPLDASAALGVLANDSGSNLSAFLVKNVRYGALQSDGAFRYTPEPGFTGTDWFLYRVKDPARSSEPYTVTIDVLDNAPFTLDDTFLRHQTTGTVTGNVASDNWDPEGEPLTVILLEDVTVGSLGLSPNGSFTFTGPGEGFAARLSKG